MLEHLDMQPIPKLDWYLKISDSRQVGPRCPFATVEACPRFYQSLSLLGRAGSTPIGPSEDRRLLGKWKKSDLWPRTAEYATSVSGPSDDPRHFMNFCPEVAFDRFGYFASSLHGHADEIDSDVAQRKLAKQEAPADHWGWAWSLVTSMHYTECPLFSPLRVRAARSADSSQSSAWRRYGVPILVGVVATVIGGILLALIL